MHRILPVFLLFVLAMPAVRAADVVNVKLMTLELAVDIAQGAIDGLPQGWLPDLGCCR